MIEDVLTSGDHPEIFWSNLLAQAGSPSADCPGPCPDGFSIFPRIETPQPPWAICASAQSPSQYRSF